MTPKKSVTPCIATLLMLTSGCVAEDQNSTHKPKPSVTPKSLEKVIINSSPVPPKGYDRPTIRIQKEKNKKKE